MILIKNRFNKALSVVFMAGSIASVNAIELPKSDVQLVSTAESQSSRSTSVSGLYIVQLKDVSGIGMAVELGELTPSNQLNGAIGNRYDASTPAMEAYTRAVRERQTQVASDIGGIEMLHNYVHTFNGFSARLTASQVNALRQHPNVASVYADELQQLDTANTPEFLGLNGALGQHTRDVKGEGVIVGILDSGIWPENPSFADDGSYSDPAELGWLGACDVGDEAETGTFSCNNKLIGARFYPSTFQSTYDIRFDLGEFFSPRDADGHGSHTASTAAGNENVAATLEGFDAGNVTGIAPRARVAAYKVCWNSNYVSPEGVNERGCFFGDSMAAIDQAIIDGVDVLNYSIGNVTGINSPVYNAAFRASQAGVFFSASAGNSGPGPDTVSNIAPWMTTVAASTYDGLSTLIGKSMLVEVDENDPESVFSIPGGITAPIGPDGFSGELALAEPALACDPISNPEAIAGQIALVARGTCAFSIKILNAQAAGASGIVVYSDNRTPLAMGGDGTGITIPGVMIQNEDGLSLAGQLSSGSSITASFTDIGVTEEKLEVGNIMADFSSRGVNPQSRDIIKPDITAPGVRILAATSSNQLDIPGNVDGESYQYLQGTSMSSPHIAGMAALLMGEHPTWTPAQVKSALMTSARQNVTKEDGFTPADPFDFGAGHAAPAIAAEPGLTYQANAGDYLGFLCGQGEDALVFSLSNSECAEIAGAGFATDASQLNYPSIAIVELEGTEVITRTVTDVTGVGGEYSVNVQSPLGINVEVTTFDSEGIETPVDTLVVPANGTASYALTFTKVPGFTPNEWTFGAVLLESAVHTVRSPIAVFPIPDQRIEVPATQTMVMNRGRASFPVRMLYSGNTSIDYVGLRAGAGVEGEAPDKNEATFNFNDAIADGSFHLFAVPEGTKVVRFSLRDSLITDASGAPVTGVDLDLHVWNCVAFFCDPVTLSEEEGTSNEDVILTNPEPRSGIGGDLYVVAIHGFNTGGNETVSYTMPTWIVDGADSSTRISSSRRAINGRFNNVRVMSRGLTPGVLYMGAVTFYDDEGEAQGTTVIEAVPQ